MPSDFTPAWNTKFGQVLSRLWRLGVDRTSAILVGVATGCTVLIAIAYQLGIETFNIDEYIAAEGVDFSLVRYLEVNPIYGAFDRSIIWVLSRLPIDEPLAWRLASAFAGVTTLIIVARQSNKIAGWPTAAVAVLLVMTQADFQFWSRWAVSSYAIAALIAALLWVLSDVRGLRTSRAGLRVTGYGLVALIGTFFSITVAVPATLIPIARLISRWPGSMSVQMTTVCVGQSGLAVLCGVAMMMIHRLDAGLRPSLFPYVFPESGLSLSEYLATRSSGLAADLVERAAIHDPLTGGVFLALIIVGVIAAGLRMAPPQLSGLKSEVKALAIVAVLLIGAHTTIGVIGLGPFGLLRHSKSLVPLSSLLLSTSGVLLVSLMMRRYCSRKPGERLTSAATALFAVIAVAVAVMICGTTIGERRTAAQNAHQSITAYTQDADLYLVDVLHKFSFERIVHREPDVLISRGYPCVDGRYWNAYGWNDCPNAYTAPSIADRDAIGAASEILVISRGSLEAAPYSDWLAALQENECEAVSQVRATGPYISRFECN